MRELKAGDGSSEEVLRRRMPIGAVYIWALRVYLRALLEADRGRQGEHTQ